MNATAISIEELNKNAAKRVVSGMRPTGALHLGHYFGVLRNWVAMQEDMDCFFFVADWHALTSEYENARQIQDFVPEMLKDWLVSGLDPERSVIFQQSRIKEHAELHLILSMVTPVSWLERCPTYKEQLQQLQGRDLGTYGFLGYPVLMTSDIIMYRPRWVPVGQDQVPHLEMSREITRRFNHFYGNFFPEPEARLTPQAKCPGLDGRKMSKSYGNSILLSENMESITHKIKTMLTDTARQRRSDPGNPEHCNLFPYHELLTDKAEQDTIRQGCLSASIGCVECKAILLKGLAAFLEPLQERRAALDAKPGYVRDVLEAGNERAMKEARVTMDGVRDLMGF
ncbi:tryptophan--tRNA ligase [Desulfovibrio sp. OttesenSCG-928-F20]|nr:tryptophan--tRNA ligase [Desulfovibrio sp. OttesenSCG-928-M16]MDL2291041.1 tryptophan--tRNA ligase [Desulfovibrio sp. OttesenSCG-928-F20]